MPVPQSFVSDAERSAEAKREQRRQSDTGQSGKVKEEGKKTKDGEGTKSMPANETESKKPEAETEEEK